MLQLLPCDLPALPCPAFPSPPTHTSSSNKAWSSRDTSSERSTILTALLPPPTPSAPPLPVPAAGRGPRATPAVSAAPSRMQSPSNGGDLRRERGQRGRKGGWVVGGWVENVDPGRERRGRSGPWGRAGGRGEGGPQWGRFILRHPFTSFPLPLPPPHLWGCREPVWAAALSEQTGRPSAPTCPRCP